MQGFISVSFENPSGSYTIELQVCRNLVSDSRHTVSSFICRIKSKRKIILSFIQYIKRKNMNTEILFKSTKTIIIYIIKLQKEVINSSYSNINLTYTFFYNWTSYTVASISCKILQKSRRGRCYHSRCEKLNQSSVYLWYTKHFSFWRLYKCQYSHKAAHIAL